MPSCSLRPFLCQAREDKSAIEGLSSQLAAATEQLAAASEHLTQTQAESDERLSNLRAKDEVLDTLRAEITNQVRG